MYSNDSLLGKLNKRLRVLEWQPYEKTLKLVEFYSKNLILNQKIKYKIYKNNYITSET